VQLEEAWIATVLFLAISAALAAGVLLAARVLGVTSKRRTKLTLSTYECGEEPEGPAWLKFHPRYYVVALVFVLFDVEAVFLFTWALVLRDLGTSAIAAMFVFIGILLLGWVFALSKGALRWQ
jgi:NADH-quinone oxidoreductase subunit A